MHEIIFKRAQEGDEHSIELLVEQYYRLAYSTAYDWIRKGAISKEDGISEANMALMKCIRGSYDPDKGDFTSYLVRSVDNQIRMYLRREKRDKSLAYTDTQIKVEDGFIDLIESLPDEENNVEDIIESSMLVTDIMKVLENDNTLKDKEVECLLLRADGLTCDEIAMLLTMSQSYVSRLSNSAAEKVKRSLGLDGGN